ncbi:sulfotransferase domain-containing protein [Lyngbya aestuarii]|uniref:sulfotransferase domain-containing protein n=1 Tax=Lyngbya aestuarii TaxID=118322 RepID=UPI00403D565B
MMTYIPRIKVGLSALKRLPLPLSIQELNASLSGPKVFASSFPKGGTNLLVRVLYLLPLLSPRLHYHVDNHTPQLIQKLSAIRGGQYLSGHVYWSPEIIDTLTTKNIRTLFVIRDLRDIAVSNAYYISYKEPEHRLHKYFSSLKSDAERLMASIVGVDGKLLKDGIRSKSIGEHATAYAPWLDEENCLTVRFEDLIGSSGGGSDEKQVETIRTITHHLGLNVSEYQINQIADKTFFKKSLTFHKGQIGNWRNHFTEEHKRVFREIAGEALMKFGYID